MTTQLEAKLQEKAAKRRLALEKALEFELAGAVEMAGWEFLGFTVKYEDGDCLIVLKASSGVKSHVAFVGSDSIANGILKCVRDAQNDRLRWRLDRYQEK